ncbi:ferritin [Nocardia donostiensis]|uniref:Bacterioferritin n=1 Tax=Nocardia donostiensis TaxID=1538463 RepID=A0A1V2TIF8_9NOCA|nr:ferritin-like domain-containing protein [Nocardia donostiensis]ONM49131.1 bacterioferritin [Nocardia donostiensis]OQS14148.1 bacterioferritin [Nocardia donostiensis]OQS19691.1 bacterioferritin [Nocardia donostiensis]
MIDSDLAHPFPALLRAHIRHGFTAAQQYLAAAVYLETVRLPQLAGHCYGRGEEHRAHALRIVQYLLDRELEVTVGGLDEVRPTFESPHAAVAFLLSREQTLCDRTSELARVARDSGDYLGERFVGWLLQRQLEDVAGMATLLSVVDRAAGNLFDVEEFVARELRTRERQPGESGPKMAGTAAN